MNMENTFEMVFKCLETTSFPKKSVAVDVRWWAPDFELLTTAVLNLVIVVQQL